MSILIRPLLLGMGLSVFAVGCAQNLAKDVNLLAQSYTNDRASSILNNVMNVSETTQGLTHNHYSLRKPELRQVESGIIYFIASRKSQCTSNGTQLVGEFQSSVAKCVIRRENVVLDIRHIKEIKISKLKDFTACGPLIAGECITLTNERLTLSAHVPTPKLMDTLAALSFYNPTITITHSY